MAGISDLPNEIFLQIFEDGVTDSWKNNKSWFSSLIRVSRTFYDLAIPLLYKDFSNIDYEYSDLYEVGLWARTLLNDDSKAALVQSVTLRFPYDAAFKGLAYKHSHPIRRLKKERAYRSMETISQAFGHDESEREKWVQMCFKKYNPAFVLALVIIQLPNLRLLHFQNSQDEIFDTLGSIMKGLIATPHAPGVKPHLASIERIKFEGWGKYADPSKRLALIARWPTTQTIVATNVGDEDNRLDPDVIPEFAALEPKSTDLKTLQLKEKCKLTGGHLYKLVGSARALEKFDYHVGHMWAWIKIKSADIPRALSQQQDSLREITLYYENIENDVNDATGHEWTAMAFSNFNRLHSLEIAAQLFFGLIDQPCLSATRQHALTALPSSLVTFSIVQCYHVHLDHSIDALRALSNEAEKFPHLEELRLAAMDGVAIQLAIELLSSGQVAEERVKIDVWKCIDSCPRLGIVPLKPDEESEIREN